MILGVDVGGVLIARVEGDADTSFFGKRFLETPAVPGAIEAVARLHRGRFRDAVWIVSKCGEQIEARTREWLAHHGFHESTGIPPERLRFCRRRADKAPICDDLGITHFVDDRLEVLGYLARVPHRILFRPEEDEVRRHARHVESVVRCEDWEEVVRACEA